MRKSPSFVAAILIRIFTIGLGVALFFEQAGARRLLRLDDTGTEPGVLMTPVHWISLIAPAFFLWALWAASDVLVRMNRGDAFGPTAVRALKEIGGALMLGSWASIVLQPSLIFLIGNGFREMHGVKFAYDVENLTLAVVGLVLMILARHGQKLKADLQQFV